MTFFTLRTILNTVALCMLSVTTLHAQIQGRIINNDQNPISNATVQLEDTKTATATDSLGYFTLESNGLTNARIVVSAVGYQTAKRALASQDNPDSIVIALAQDNLNLNEVVISASRYGMERKKAPVIVNVLSPKLLPRPSPSPCPKP